MNKLSLKYGNVKWGAFPDEPGRTLLDEYIKCDDGSFAQLEAICALIDAVDDPKGIYNEYTNTYMTKHEAVIYVMEYRKRDTFTPGAI